MAAKINRASKAFTLTEMLVVISVVIILASMLVLCIDGLYTYAIRLQCQHRMEQIWHACLTYQTRERILPNAWDYDHGRPWYATLHAEGYLDNTAVYTCPSSDLPSSYGTGSSGSSPGSGRDDHEALLGALRWLAKTQNADGSWSRSNNSNNPAANTAGCLLAFLGAGRLDSDPEFGDVVRKAVDYLAQPSVIAWNGWVSNLVDNSWRGEYTQGLYLMAMSDAAQYLTSTEYKDKARAKAQLALTYLLNYHPPTGGYAYDAGVDPGGPSVDTSMTTWVAQGFAQAYSAGLDFENTNPPPNPDHISRALIWAERVTIDLGTQAMCHYRPNHMNLGWISDKNVTAAVLAARLLLGQAPTDEHCVEMARWIFAANNGQTMLDFTQSGNRLYALYYTTIAMRLMGDSSERAWWTEWEAHFLPVLLNTKANGGLDGNGKETFYWTTAADANYGGELGNPLCTALSCLSLEVSLGQNIAGSKWNTSTSGAHSYGYNKLIANDENGRRKPAGDTIVLMDYLRDGIDYQDPIDYIVPRHDGKANVMFADGHCEALAVEDLIEERPNNPDKYRIKRQWLTLEAGSEGHLDED